MTEAEWMGCADSGTMLAVLGERVWGRKRMLCGCGATRHFWHLLKREVNRIAVEASQRFADGLSSLEELRQAWQAIEWEPVIYVDWPIGWLAGPVSREVEDSIYAVDRDDLYNFPERRSNESRLRDQCDIIRDLYGNPFRPVMVDPAWQTSAVVSLAQAIYDERAFDRMPILADALEDAGCTNADVLTHCRQPGENVRGCWVIDLLLGKK